MTVQTISASLSREWKSSLGYILTNTLALSFTFFFLPLMCVKWHLPGTVIKYGYKLIYFKIVISNCLTSAYGAQYMTLSGFFSILLIIYFTCVNTMLT
jgi:hypothetical protein